MTVVQKPEHSVVMFSGFYVSAFASQEGCQALLQSPEYCLIPPSFLFYLFFF